MLINITVHPSKRYWTFLNIEYLCKKKKRDTRFLLVRSVSHMQCSPQIKCVSSAVSLTQCVLGQRARAVPSAGSVGSTPAAASRSLHTHTHTKPRQTTEAKGQGLGVKVHGSSLLVDVTRQKARRDKVVYT